MNSFAILEQEYKLLLAEMKKRYGNIREVLEPLHLTAFLARRKGASENANNLLSRSRLAYVASPLPAQTSLSAIAFVELLLQPLVLIFETKTTKLYILALNCLQKLASMSFVDEVRVLSAEFPVAVGCNSVHDETAERVMRG